MRKRKNIFDLLSLKKKIDLNKKHKISDELSSEGIKNAKLIEQIKELQDQKCKEDAGTRSAYFLKSDTWYSQKLAEERQKTETKQKFIDRELNEIRKKIAIDHQNISRAQKKATEIRKKEEALNDIRRELLTPKINKI